MKPHEQPRDAAPQPPPPPVERDEDYHCENCMFLGDPANPGSGFWACQNLCIRD